MKTVYTTNLVPDTRDAAQAAFGETPIFVAGRPNAEASDTWPFPDEEFEVVGRVGQRSGPFFNVVKKATRQTYHSPEILFAPLTGGHVAGKTRDRIVIRRPAEFLRDRGSATAIKIEAYVQHNGPRYPLGEEMVSDVSEPIYVELIWANADHRPTWDARTGGRCGHTGEPEEYMDPTARGFACRMTDVERVEQAIATATREIQEWNAKGAHPWTETDHRVG